ncbi:tRNA lysidine(34) synthetase TilS [Chitinophaga cymbidii]|nr:tRNA lysidine(34) synthetase TilS [Chitinophaga cymbidii]
MMLSQLQSYIHRERLFDPAQRLLLAVSGGMDSVVLTHLCVAAGFNIGIAHCNFRLRGGESERDEQFVRRLAERYNVPFYLQQFDTAERAQAQKQSIQVAARELRYMWLEKIRQEEGYDHVATAHHMQDNVETLWMNISKGTGMAGLHGILPKQGKLVRPLLFATREEITAYANAHQLEHVEDSSNATDKYTRNFFRHRVLPLLEEAYPQVVKNTGAGIQRFREAEMLYQQAIAVHRRNLLEQRKQEYFIPVLKLKQAQPLQTILYELLKPFQCSAAQAAQVAELVDSEPGKWVATPTYRIVRDRKWLIITPLEPAASAHFVIEKGQETVQLPEAQLLLKTCDPAHISTDPHIAYIDKQQVQFPLLLRKWKQGDYFYPLGMDKKKKLSRFFIDQKLSLPEKEKIWVLESHKKIVWIAGMRIDNRFRITPGTREALKIELKNT